MTEERRNSWVRGCLLLVSALGCISLRNNPMLGISPLAIGTIEALVYVCIAMCVCLSDWRMAIVIAVIVPVYLWTMRFMDAFMIPVNVLVNVVIVGSILAVVHFQPCYAVSVLILTFPAFFTLLLSETFALWMLKHEGLKRAFIAAWNTSIYSGLSISGAALISAFFRKVNRSHC